MRSNYLLYPEAKEKLEKAGLLERIKDAGHSDEGLPHIGHTSEDDIHLAVKDLKEEGYLETIPNEIEEEYKKGIQNTFNNRDQKYWKIERDGEEIRESVDLEDFYLLTGWMASNVLSKEEFWNYRENGFDSLSEFFGAVGAAIQNEVRGDYERGYKWASKNPSGRLLENCITGDHNLDLRILQRDLTPDVTIDPLGNKVDYRPGISDDRKGVYAYHSTEPEFLTGVLKWIDQQDIESEMLKNNGNPLIEYARSLGWRIGAATECFGFGEPHAALYLGSFDLPIPVLNQNFETGERTNEALTVNGEAASYMYVGPNKELVFSYENHKQDNPIKTPSLIFQPSDADDILKGIFYQSAMGLGRTVPQNLIPLIEYRFSGEMERDIAEMKKRLNLG